ncbi:MAG: DEAD/DEAH box helicase [Candidatus Caldarchaeum sp.]|nr:DEAD/DEAH box helicase [Candidatus Caldarchaeum sp.]
MNNAVENGADVLNRLVKPLKDAVLERFGKLTEPQIKAIPKLLDGSNLLLMAPTGTGKTEAALLPLINNLLISGDFEGVKILYITPLRALNRDLLDRVEWWASRFDMTVAVRHGDTGTRERRTQSLSPPTILITTPETLQILLTARLFREHLKRVQAVVVDEVHELAGDKRGSQLSLALERLVELAGRDFQRVGLSATVGSPEKIASFLAGVGREWVVVRVPVVKSLQLSVEFPSPVGDDFELAEKLSVHPEVAARMNLIRKLVESHESTLVFTNTRPLAEILTNRFRAWDESAPIGIHHGSLSKTTRIGAEQALKSGGLAGVVCTSSLEMGIDVGRIELCIQYNSPREVTRIVQRVGRSGHTVSGTAKGVVIVTDSDDALESIVINRRAYNDMIEEVELFENSYDVLAHQLAGLLIERKQLSIDHVQKVFRRSYCFRNLSKEQLVKTAQHLEKLGAAILTSDGILETSPKTANLYDYYFNNLTMIPEEKQYLVVSESTGEAVGILDEEFVAEYGEPGTRFILMGKAWEIIQTGGERIYVAALDSLEGAVPSWVGEEIPVPYEVAQEVGAVRRRYAEALQKNRGDEELEALAKEYRADKNLLEKSLREVEEHVRRGLPIPSDTTVLLEETPEYIVLHVCGGLKPNRTLARAIAYHVSETLGAAVTVQQDAYRIVFKSREITAEAVAESIKNLADETTWRSVFTKAVESSSLFRRRLVHVARKMGMIAKDASILDISASKLAEMLKDTVVYEEALNHSVFADFDSARAHRLLKDMASGNLRLSMIRDVELSPLARLTVNRYASDIDVIASERLQRLVVNAVRGRLNNEPLTLVCTDCWSWHRKIIVKEIELRPVCQACGSSKVGVLREEPEKILNLLARKGRPANRAEKFLKKQASKTAELVAKYGKAAVFTLASKFVDLDEAAQILEREQSIGVRLVELIIETEKKKIQSMFAA